MINLLEIKGNHVGVLMMDAQIPTTIHLLNKVIRATPCHNVGWRISQINMLQMLGFLDVSIPS